MAAETNRLSLSLAEIIRGRRSVRRLLDRPVEREHILTMLEAARWRRRRTVGSRGGLWY